MADATLLHRVERFERTVATCLCTVPVLFAGQCLVASLALPVFEAMFADFGAQLPALTRFVIEGRILWILLALGTPISTVIVARKGPPNFAVIYATGSGLFLFALAQTVTAGMFLPVFELGAVAGGVK